MRCSVFSPCSVATDLQVRSRVSMTKRPRRGGQQKKTQRFATLRKRRAHKSTLYAALEHRRREETVRLQAARRRCVKTTGHPRVATIDRRRKEYLEIPASQPLIPSRKILASLAIACAVPLVLAIAGNIHLRQAPVSPVAMRAHALRPRVAIAQPAPITRGKHMVVAAAAPVAHPAARPEALPHQITTAPRLLTSARRRAESVHVQTNAQPPVLAQQPQALPPQPIVPEPSVHEVSLAPEL